MGLFTKMFGSDNSRNISKLEKIASKVEALEDKYRAYSDDQLRVLQNTNNKLLLEDKK